MSSITPTITADGQFEYDAIFPASNNYKLSELVEICYLASAEKLGWCKILKYTPKIFKGQFGYDGYAASIGYLLKNYRDGMTRDEMGHYLHNGWCYTYWHWRDEKPYLTHNFYVKPRNALGDKRRDECASLNYGELNDDEKYKNIVTMDALKKVLKLKTCF